jgi:hypothetical protein
MGDGGRRRRAHTKDREKLNKHKMDQKKSRVVVMLSYGITTTTAPHKV